MHVTLRHTTSYYCILTEVLSYTDLLSYMPILPVLLVGPINYLILIEGKVHARVNRLVRRFKPLTSTSPATTQAPVNPVGGTVKISNAAGAEEPKASASANANLNANVNNEGFDDTVSALSFAPEIPAVASTNVEGN